MTELSQTDARCRCCASVHRRLTGILCPARPAATCSYRTSGRSRPGCARGWSGPPSRCGFIPAREDKTATGRGPVQQRAMEECPPGHVLVVDARGDARAASAGDIYCGRLKARGCAGIVTDGGLRDTEGVFKTRLCRPIIAARHHRRAGSSISRPISTCRSPAAVSPSIRETSSLATATGSS